MLHVTCIQLDTDKYMIKKENVNFHNHFHILCIIPMNINQYPPC